MKAEVDNMSSSSSEFTLYARAERQLCDAAAPMLGDLLRRIEAELGVSITEVRVTVQRQGRDGGLVTANCTIVSAQTMQTKDRCLTETGRNDSIRNASAAG